jgi:hypothetical protein
MKEISICDKCHIETELQLYPFGHWYYDNSGGFHNVGEEINICFTCLKEIEDE